MTHSLKGQAPQFLDLSDWVVFQFGLCRHLFLSRCPSITSSSILDVLLSLASPSLTLHHRRPTAAL